MRIPVLQGRAFTSGDLATNAEPVVVVDEQFARRFWPRGDAIGRHVWGDPARKMKIVGVVGTVKQYGLNIEGRIVFYRPTVNAQWHVVRTSSDPMAVARDIVRKIHEMDSTITVVDIQPMTQRMHQSMARQRFSTMMLGAFALFALVLAVVGVYGVMSHLVTQGSHDIGVRMALGAERSRILGMVLRQGMELTAAGVVLGLAGALLLTRVMATLLFGVSTSRHRDVRRRPPCVDRHGRDGELHPGATCDAGRSGDGAARRVRRQVRATSQPACSRPTASARERSTGRSSAGQRPRRLVRRSASVRSPRAHVICARPSRRRYLNARESRAR